MNDAIKIEHLVEKCRIFAKLKWLAALTFADDFGNIKLRISPQSVRNHPD